MRIGIFAFMGFALICFALMYVHDSLLRIHYKDYKKDWIKHGKPQGYFYVPEGILAKFDIRTWRPTWNYPWKMFFRTPYWVSNEPVARRLVFAIPALNILGVIFWLLFFIFGLESL